MSAPSAPTLRSPLALRAAAILAVIYVLAAHAVDTLAANGSVLGIEWSRFRWNLGNGIDLFKFIAWFLIPLALSIPTLDFGYFTFRRWKRVDWMLLALFVVGGGIVVFLLPYWPGVGDYYGGWGHLAPSRRWDYAMSRFLWTLSWLSGWEFAHRYFLIRPLQAAWPRGWIAVLVIVPAIEVLYHVIQEKPMLESLGMGGLSLLMCAWTLSRRNSLLPFLGHLAIEVELIAYLYFH